MAIRDINDCLAQAIINFDEKAITRFLDDPTINTEEHDFIYIFLYEITRESFDFENNKEKIDIIAPILFENCDIKKDYYRIFETEAIFELICGMDGMKDILREKGLKPERIRMEALDYLRNECPTLKNNFRL